MGQAKRIFSDVERIIRECGSATAEVIRNTIVESNNRGTRHGIRTHDVAYNLRLLKSQKKVKIRDPTDQPVEWEWTGKE